MCECWASNSRQEICRHRYSIYRALLHISFLMEKSIKEIGVKLQKVFNFLVVELNSIETGFSAQSIYTNYHAYLYNLAFLPALILYHSFNRFQVICQLYTCSFKYQSKSSYSCHYRLIWQLIRDSNQQTYPSLS